MQTKQQKAEAGRKWRAKNKDRVIANRIKYKKANHELINKRARDYHNKNKHIISIKQKKYREENIDEIRRKDILDKHVRPEAYLLYSAKRRAKKKNLPFELITSDIIIPDICPVFGIPIKTNDGKFADDSASLDRINPKLGYIKSNIIVISFRANRLKNDATLEELERLARFYRELHNAPSQD